MTNRPTWKSVFFPRQCYIFWGKFIYWYAEKKERHPSRPTATVTAVHRYATQPTAACIQITPPLEIRRKTRVTLKIPSTWHQASRRPAASGAKNTNEVNNRFWTPLALQRCRLAGGNQNLGWNASRWRIQERHKWITAYWKQGPNFHSCQ